jgi:E3 ubiquitin-protein ligase MYCBP2
MWHEGIVHDAMACASFLKFHPDLTKAMSQVKDKKQAQPTSGSTGGERVRQRHATGKKRGLDQLFYQV